MLLSVLPIVSRENVFALRGGTVINLFFIPINHHWKNIAGIMNTQNIPKVIVISDTRPISLVNPSRLIKEILDIYQATNTKSIIPTKKKYVVYH